MNAGPDERPLLERVAGWHGVAQLGLRSGAVALAALMAAYLGAFALKLPPWAAIALPLGLTLAAARRWGTWPGLGSALGLWVALVTLPVEPITATVSALVVFAAAMGSRTLLRRLGFDTRLERAADIVMLSAVCLLGLSLPVGALLAGLTTLPGPDNDLRTFLTGWCVLALGATTTAALLLTVDRSALQSLQPGAPLRKALSSVAALALTVWLLWMSPAAGPGLAAVAFFLPLVVLTMLALREQFALAGAGLLVTGLLAASQAGGGTATLAAWYGAALCLVLMAHAVTMQWRGRAHRWEWALDGSRLGVADWHLQLQDSFASAAWRTLSGHGARGWTPEDWQAQVHPEDRNELTQAIASLSAGDAGRAGIEIRMPRGTGWRWAEATLMVIERDVAGRPLRLLATLADIQDRREALERQRMSASLFQHLHEGLLITDPELHVLDANPAYSQILGVPRDELLGTVPSLLRPTPADPVARQQRATMWASLRDQGSWRGELMERRRNGEPCVLQATISTVYGPGQGGEQTLRYHVLVISDITEQQAQRDQLERQAHFDELTRLPNRARLSQLLDDAIRAADRDGYLLVVSYLDLDRFKPVNDRWGHAAGDRLLSELAGRLRGALRSREGWTDSAARLGGDEFVLLLRAGTLEEARLALDRVLRVVS